MIARSCDLVGAQDVAVAVLTVLSQGVAVKAGFAYLAVGTVGVVQAPKATARARIAVAGLTLIRVVATLAGLATTAGCFGIAKVILGAVFASGPGVALETFADHVLRYRI